MRLMTEGDVLYRQEFRREATTVGSNVLNVKKGCSNSENNQSYGSGSNAPSSSTSVHKYFLSLISHRSEEVCGLAEKLSVWFGEDKWRKLGVTDLKRFRFKEFQYAWGYFWFTNQETILLPEFLKTVNYRSVLTLMMQPFLTKTSKLGYTSTARVTLFRSHSHTKRVVFVWIFKGCL